MSETNCTTCHLHKDGFTPSGGCNSCHDQPQGDRRQIFVENGDFDRTSHHVNGDVTEADCIACHYMRDHGSGTVKLKDSDQGNDLVYDYDPNNPQNIETFCLNCHDDDGASAGGGAQPFSDGMIVPNVKGVTGSFWSNSAHKTRGYLPNDGNPITCFGNGATTGCHGNGHGSDNIKLLSASQSISLDQFCFNCHTDGMITNNAISGNSLADDIEQAFEFVSENKHDLGSSFTMGGNSFSLQCTSCHNPHIVTGKYWQADQNQTPVTLPDFSDPVNNPRAMGSILWGGSADEVDGLLRR